MEGYHLIGIKGSGMSALAQILYSLGNDMQGSDVNVSYFTEIPLREKGIRILPFSTDNIKHNYKIIASNAYGDDHVEIAYCIKNGIKVFRYHEFLGDFIKGFQSIGVAGTHGKTSTTGLLAHVLKNTAPTSYLIGDGTGVGARDSKYFLFEACEYRNHFLAYQPDVAVITNIGYDHPDYFSSLDAVIESFQNFAHQVNSMIIACGDDENVRKIHCPNKIIYYGLNDTNQLVAKNVGVTRDFTTFEVYYENQSLGKFAVPLFGRHNVLNALAVIGVCITLDLDLEHIKAHFKTYAGVSRRFSERIFHSNVIIDDYAHHPTEITATIEAAKTKYPQKEIIAIFQPHTFSRLEKLLDEFAVALRDADDIFLCDIFTSAREKNGNITIASLLDKIPNAKYIDEHQVDVLSSYTNSVLLFMGAGDVNKLIDRYVAGN